MPTMMLAAIINSISSSSSDKMSDASVKNVKGYPLGGLPHSDVAQQRLHGDLVVCRGFR